MFFFINTLFRLIKCLKCHSFLFAVAKIEIIGKSEVPISSKRNPILSNNPYLTSYGGAIYGQRERKRVFQKSDASFASYDLIGLEVNSNRSDFLLSCSPNSQTTARAVLMLTVCGCTATALY